MSTGPETAPVFISYSRRDYYFAESLALHLLKEGVPAWLDVKDLNPGVFWSRDLFAALDSACCVVLVVSHDSLKSPNVQQEIARATEQKKRILIARFRGARLPENLCQCEVIDFRGSFSGGLRRLKELLEKPPSAPARSAAGRPLPKAPLWVLTIVLFLTVPTIAYVFLGDWGNHSQLVNASYMLLFGSAVAWFMSYSFVQRKMGMTRLAINLICLGIIFSIPLILVLRGGPSLAHPANPLVLNAEKHFAGMAALAIIPLLGLALLVLFGPYDLLRWTPTGKAWNWYRKRCAVRLFASQGNTTAIPPQPFRLLYDVEDRSAAQHIQTFLEKANWKPSADIASATPLLLLTNRTRLSWLMQQQPSLAEKVATIVMTTICLPSEAGWLWSHEWIDMRQWTLQHLQCKEVLPQVPEAVTVPSFPGVVRLANHLLCAMAGLVFVLFATANPSMMADTPNPNPSVLQELSAIAIFIMVALPFETGRRLLRRTLSARGFVMGGALSWIAAVVVAAAAWIQGIPAPPVLRFIPVTLFLLAFPLAILRLRQPLTFWFPTSPMKFKESKGTLAVKRIWRTLLWSFLYAGLWMVVLGAIKN